MTESTSMVVWEWGQDREGRGKDYKRTQGDEYVHFLGCGEGFADVARSNFQIYTLDVCNYMSIIAR